MLWVDCWLECSAAGCVLVFMEFFLPSCLSYHPWWDAHVGTTASTLMCRKSSVFCLPLCFSPAFGVNSSLLDLVPLQYDGTHPHTQLRQRTHSTPSKPHISAASNSFPWWFRTVALNWWVVTQNWVTGLFWLDCEQQGSKHHTLHTNSRGKILNANMDSLSKRNILQVHFIKDT